MEIPMEIPMEVSRSIPKRLNLSGELSRTGQNKSPVPHEIRWLVDGKAHVIWVIVITNITWVNYNDLTTTSLEIMVSKGNHPQMALIQVSEIL